MGLNMRKPIVILGGMGPQASLRLHELLVQKSQTYHTGANDAYPYIVHISLPTPDFISDEAQKPAALQTMQEITPIVKALQPAQLLLACNTAHILQPDSTLLRHTTFLSLIDVAANYAEEEEFAHVGLLASPTTVRSKLYTQALERRGIACVTPTATEYAAIESVIRRVIGGNHTPRESRKLATIAKRLRQRGADAILLGCTELPLAFDKTLCQLPVIDCLDVYATVSARRYYLYNGE